MFWSTDSCQNSVSTDQYRLTVSRAQVSTHWVRVFFMKLSADKLLILQWSQAQVQFFLNACEISRVDEPHFKNFDFTLTSDAKIHPAFTCLTFLTIVTRWSRSKSNFYALIGCPVLMFIQTLDSSNWIVGACQKCEPVRLAEGDFENFFIIFTKSP